MTGVTVRAFLVLLVTGLLAAGCGGDAPGSGGPDGAGGRSTWPLTGLAAADGDAVALDAPVLVVKIDNTTSSRPQAGLGGADLVVEELVEGGLTRLAVFYHSGFPARVGPVRSMRTSDVGIVSPVGGAIVTSGAASQVKERIKGAGLRYFEEGTPGIGRDASRRAPYNVFADLSQIAEAAATDSARPPDFLTWGKAGDLPEGRPATSLTAAFSSARTTEWAYRDGRYVNANSNAADGDGFAADTVLVLRVQVTDAGYVDRAGNPVPETRLEGSGAAVLLHGGRAIRCRWVKDGLDGAIRLTTSSGELRVPAGHTWIELVPADRGRVSFR